MLEEKGRALLAKVRAIIPLAEEKLKLLRELERQAELMSYGVDPQGTWTTSTHLEKDGTLRVFLPGREVKVPASLIYPKGALPPKAAGDN